MDDEPTLGLGGAGPAPRAEAYRVLARKYRPQTFEGLIGQAAMVRTLANAFALGRIAHAFMLTGVRGVGKTTTARIIARALNCTGADGTNKAPTMTPCGQCEACIAIAESRHMDVLEMDAASRTGIDDIREIVESVRYAPAGGRYKVYIIDEVHMLSKAAFNGLLKTLEEPPPHVIFIFATTEIRRVPVTVLSRCQRFDLRRIDAAALVTHLRGICEAEKVAIEDAALALIARAAEGSVRDALSLLDQAIAHGEEGTPIAAAPVREMLGLADRARSLDLFEALMRGDLKRALEELRAQYNAGAEPLLVIEDLLEITHALTRLRAVPDAVTDPGLTDAASGRAAGMAKALPVSILSRCWQVLLKGLSEVREAPQAIDAAEMLLIRLAFAADLPSPERLIAEMTDTQGTTGDGAPRPPSPPAPRSQPRGTVEAMPRQAPPREVEEEAAAPRLQRFEDVVALAGSHRDMLFKRALERQVHLVHFSAGRIDLRLAPDAPNDLAAQLSRKLQAWTGERWLISVVSEEGAPTLHDQRRADAAANEASAREHELVQAALAAFPGARLVTVRTPIEDAAPDIEEMEE
ncbi:MAG: DNA polymerase III subunit gamma/tau [Alphaproteobacteria bacterium]|nr:DNA polymerase III subunit gamma/tau [Alphaproteobacteria bacterium]